jgi:S-DNA-T family DNA segregation ATPase FtsK/SpoIIIE
MADRLPAIPDDDLIVEGEIVDDDPPAPQRATGTAMAIVTDRRTQFTARQAAYVGLGVGVFFRRLWESRSATRFDRWLRGAEAAGDREGLLAI